MKTTPMKKIVGLLMLGSLGLMATHAQADWDRDGHTPRQSRLFIHQIDARQAQQRDRIHAGLHDGSLSRHEFRDLMHEQHRIQAMKRHFLADGVIDAREFRRLDRALDRASRDIRIERHDRPGRPAFDAGPWNH